MDTLFYLADQNPHRDRSRGISEYTQRLVKGLRATNEFDISCLTSTSSYQGEAGARKITLPFRTDHSVGRLGADFFHPLWLSRRTHVHYPKGYLPGLRPKARLVSGTMHDMILPFYMDNYPEARSKVSYTYWLGTIKRSVSRFDLILTISEKSGEAIREFCQRHKITCPPIRVTYLASRWQGETASAATKQDMVVHLGSVEPHKRTMTLLESWKKIAPRNLHLVIAGTLTHEATKLATELRTVQLKPSLPNEELKSLIAHARAIIIPSEVEGFGLPAVEAYAMGTPAVYVKGTAIEEVLGVGTPGAFELADLDSLGAALQSVLHLSPAEVSATSAKLAAKFSWEKCTQSTVVAFREALATS